MTTIAGGWRTGGAGAPRRAAALAAAVVLLAGLPGPSASAGAAPAGPTSVPPAPFDAPAAAGPAAAFDSVLTSLAVGNAPLAGTFDAANGLVYVPADGNSLAVLSGGTTPGIVTRIPFPPNAQVQTPTFVNRTGFLYVPVQVGGPDFVEILNASNDEVGIISTGLNSSPTTPVYDPAVGYLAIPDQGTNAISFANATTGTLERVVPVGSQPTTPVFDTADQDLYVPNQGSNNLSIVSGTQLIVVATIPGLALPGTPAFDPLNAEVYVPQGNGTNVTVLFGTSVVATAAVGDLPGTPAIDPATGNILVPNGFDSNLTVLGAGTNAPIAAPVTGNGPTTPVLDPANGDFYVANAEDGSLAAVDPRPLRTVAVFGVGDGCYPPVLDPTTDQLFVVNSASNNVSVVAAGPWPTASAPGSYTISFVSTGLASGTPWSVTLGPTTFNLTSPTIAFYDRGNATIPYTIQGPPGYYLFSPAAVGSVEVHGADRTVAVSFGAQSGGGNGSTQRSQGFGLSTELEYGLGGVFFVGLGVVAALWLARRRGAARDDDPDDAPEAGADAAPEDRGARANRGSK